MAELNRHGNFSLFIKWIPWTTLHTVFFQYEKRMRGNQIQTGNIFSISFACLRMLRTSTLKTSMVGWIVFENKTLCCQPHSKWMSGGRKPSFIYDYSTYFMWQIETFDFISGALSIFSIILYRKSYFICHLVSMMIFSLLLSSPQNVMHWNYSRCHQLNIFA